MSKNAQNRIKNRNRIKKHVRKKITGTPECPRLAVYRSLRYIYAQIIDDVNNKTLCSTSSLSKTLAGEVKEAKSKVEVAHIVGKKVGEKAKELKIEEVVFDRSGYRYHGRVKAVADGAREAGLKF